MQTLATEIETLVGGAMDSDAWVETMRDWLAQELARRDVVLARGGRVSEWRKGRISMLEELLREAET